MSESQKPGPKLLVQVRQVMRLHHYSLHTERFHHYSIRTEKAYLHWIRRCLEFHRGPDRTGPHQGWRHPGEMGPADIREFLTHLAVSADVAASTQKLAPRFAEFEMTDFRLQIGGCRDGRRRIPDIARQHVSTVCLPSRLRTLARCRICSDIRTLGEVSTHFLHQRLSCLQEHCLTNPQLRHRDRTFAAGAPVEMDAWPLQLRRSRCRDRGGSRA